MTKERTYGLELEKPISDTATGKPHGMSQDVFNRLEQATQQRGTQLKRHMSDIQPEMTLGVISDDLGEQGVDNGYNLQETSLPYTHELNELASLAELDLTTLQSALEAEGATAINMSIHPLGRCV